MTRVVWVVALLVVSVSSGAVYAARTDLAVTGIVVAVVSGAEIDVAVTRSAIPEIVAEGTVVRVAYHGLAAPGRFDPLYMEVFDINWNLVNDSELYFDVAKSPWDDELRLHAYVYLDPSGHGMVNVFLLASGLAAIDPGLGPDEPHAAQLIDLAAVAEQNNVGIWAKADEP